MGLEALSDADLMALKSGDLSKVSNDGLMALKQPSASIQQKSNIAEQIANDAISKDARANVDIRKAMRRDFNSNLVPTTEGKGLGQALDEAAYNIGGKVTDVTGSPLLGTAANVAVSALPVYAGGEVSKMAIPAQRWMAEKLMQSAIKPGTKDLMTGKADRAIATLLDKGINVSEGGMNKLRMMGSKINNDVDNVISQSNAVINKYPVEARLADVEKRFQNQVNPQSDLAAIEAVSKDFLSHPDLLGQQLMPIQLAQKLKQGTHSQLRDKYGELGSASTEAQKALARGLREEIEKVAPQVKDLNANASEIWNALNVAQRRALGAGNANPVGIGALGGPKSALLFGASNNSFAKSLAARLLNSTKDAVPDAVRLGIAARNLNEGEQQ